MEELRWPYLDTISCLPVLFHLFKSLRHTPILPHIRGLSYYASPLGSSPVCNPRAPLIIHTCCSVLSHLLSCDTFCCCLLLTLRGQKMQVRLQNICTVGAHSGLSMCVCAKTKGGHRSKGWVEGVTSMHMPLG